LGFDLFGVKSPIGPAGCALGYGAAMARDDSKPANASRGRFGFLLDHPIIFAVFATCTLVGVVMGVFLLTEDWSLARRIAGGAVGGAGVALIITAPRIIG
jgi:hypothetical protein